MSQFRNKQLAKDLAGKKPQAKLVAVRSVPKPTTTNIAGGQGYDVNIWIKLLAMLNTLKFETQFYKSKAQQFLDLAALIDKCAKSDVYLTAQCIVYSRCMGEGMRTISHIAAALLARYIGGQPWAKHFYSVWNREKGFGGVIFRADDMAEIAACYTFLNATPGRPFMLPNSMKKGFRAALESMTAYVLLKYKSAILDLINYVHPRPERSTAKAKVGRKNYPVFEVIIKGMSASADTHEAANSEAGQIVAGAVKDGKISRSEADEILVDAKASNWKGLIMEGKLGILAALRNIRNILINKPDSETISALIAMFNRNNILNGKIMPYQLDLAQEVITTEFSTVESRKVVQRLLAVYEESLPNLAVLLNGNNLVIVDFSGSMWMSSGIIKDPMRKSNYRSFAGDKAALIAATICKATNCDLIRFGENAEYLHYNPNQDVFSMSKSIVKQMGATNLERAWNLAARSGRKYDRVFILSDHECNRGSAYTGYTNYMSQCGDPYVYSIDLAAYGTQSLAGPKVNFYYGYGYKMFEDIAVNEFNAKSHLDKVRKIRFS